MCRSGLLGTRVKVWILAFEAAYIVAEQAELSASESERGRLADALAASARQVESAVNQLREAQAAADRSEERARRAEHVMEEVTITGSCEQHLNQCKHHLSMD